MNSSNTRENKVFVDDDVESIVKEKFTLKEAFPVRISTLSNYEKIMTLQDFQAKMREHIKCVNHIAKMTFLSVITEKVDKLPDIAIIHKNEDVSNSFSNTIQEITKNALLSFNKNLYKLENYILYRYLDLSHNIPAFQNQFTKLFLISTYEEIKNNPFNWFDCYIIAINKSYENTSPGLKFIEYYANDVNIYIDMFSNIIKKKLHFMCDVLKSNLYSMYKQENDKFNDLDYYNGGMNRFKTLKSKGILKKIRKNMQKLIESCNSNLCAKLKMVFIEELDFILNDIVEEEKCTYLRILDKVKNYVDENFHSEFKKLKISLKSIKQDMLDLDKFFLRLGMDEKYQFKHSLQEIIYTTSQMEMNLQYKAYSLFHSVLMIIDNQDPKLYKTHTDKYISSMFDLFNVCLCSVIEKLIKLEKNIRIFSIKLNTKKIDFSEINLSVLPLINIDVLLKINTIYDYIEAIWTRLFCYQELQTEAYIYMNELRKSDATIKSEYKLIKNDPLYDKKIFKNKILEFNVGLIVSFESIIKFYADVFETNFLYTLVATQYILELKLLSLINNFLNKISMQQLLHAKILKFMEATIRNRLKYIRIQTSSVANDRLTFTTHKIGMRNYNALLKLTPGILQTQSNSTLLAFIKPIADLNFYKKYKNKILFNQNSFNNINININFRCSDKFFSKFIHRKRPLNLFYQHPGMIETIKNIFDFENQNTFILSCGLLFIAIIYALILIK